MRYFKKRKYINKKKNKYKYIYFKEYKNGKQIKIKKEEYYKKKQKGGMIVQKGGPSVKNTLDMYKNKNNYSLTNKKYYNKNNFYNNYNNFYNPMLPSVYGLSDLAIPNIRKAIKTRLNDIINTKNLSNLYQKNFLFALVSIPNYPPWSFDFLKLPRDRFSDSSPIYNANKNIKFAIYYNISIRKYKELFTSRKSILINPLLQYDKIEEEYNYFKPLYKSKVSLSLLSFLILPNIREMGNNSGFFFERGPELNQYLTIAHRKFYSKYNEIYGPYMRHLSQDYERSVKSFVKSQKNAKVDKRYCLTDEEIKFIINNQNDLSYFYRQNKLYLCFQAFIFTNDRIFLNIFDLFLFPQRYRNQLIRQLEMINQSMFAIFARILGITNVADVSKYVQGIVKITLGQLIIDYRYYPADYGERVRQSTGGTRISLISLLNLLKLRNYKDINFVITSLNSVTDIILGDNYWFLGKVIHTKQSNSLQLIDFMTDKPFNHEWSTRYFKSLLDLSRYLEPYTLISSYTPNVLKNNSQKGLYVYLFSKDNELVQVVLYGLKRGFDDSIDKRPIAIPFKFISSKSRFPLYLIKQKQLIEFPISEWIDKTMEWDTVSYYPVKQEYYDKQLKPYFVNTFLNTFMLQIYFRNVSNLAIYYGSLLFNKGLKLHGSYVYYPVYAFVQRLDELIKKCNTSKQKKIKILLILFENINDSHFKKLPIEIQILFQEIYFISYYIPDNLRSITYFMYYTPGITTNQNIIYKELDRLIDDEFLDRHQSINEQIENGTITVEQYERFYQDLYDFKMELLSSPSLSSEPVGEYKLSDFLDQIESDNPMTSLILSKIDPKYKVCLLDLLDINSKEEIENIILTSIRLMIPFGLYFSEELNRDTMLRIASQLSIIAHLYLWFGNSERVFHFHIYFKFNSTIYHLRYKTQYMSIRDNNSLVELYNYIINEFNLTELEYIFINSIDTLLDKTIPPLNPLIN